MARFRRKVTEVDAFQWFPGTDVEGVVGNWDNNPMTPSKASVMTIHGQYADLAPGDYVVTEPDGEHHYPVKQEIFEQNYEPIDD